jgi:Family of unknown function (DUF6356)
MFEAGKKHIADAGETYFQHQRVAFSYAAQCFLAGFMACVHGIFPQCFTTSASEKIAALAQHNRQKR